jgi:predicted outer membrane repeat protein
VTSSKPCGFVLTILTCITIFSTVNAAEHNLLMEDTSLQSYSKHLAIQSPDLAESTLRSRYVSINTKITENLNITTEDKIILNLFDDASYAAHIDKISENINKTITIKGSIESHPYSEVLICRTGDQVFVNIYIPDANQRFIIRKESGTEESILMEMNPGQEPALIDGPSILSNIRNLSGDNQPSSQIETDPSKPASIDIMLVYTPAAYDDAGFYFCGIDNYIAYLLDEANTVLERSQTYVTLNLVHSAMVNYTENRTGYRYIPGVGWVPENSLETALRQLSEKDGIIDEIHSWRNQYGADLVSLLVSRKLLRNSNNYFGYASQLTKASGNSNEAFSVIVTEYLNYTFIHELGHNMGCGHSKYQSIYNYGGLFSYSYGWSWTTHCSVMSYPENNYTRIGIFSNPDVLDDDTPTGDYKEADNARTIRETKHFIAAYRAHVDANQVSIPEHIPARIYVNANAHHSGNGQNWSEAYKHLRDALIAAQAGDEIWAAAGTYKPTDGTINNTDRYKSFILRNDISVYGGFNGTETERDQRDWIKNKTILSGDIGISGRVSDNCLRIILGAENSVLDGFTITGAYGDNSFYPSIGDGGCIYLNKLSNVTIANCTFSDNYSLNAGCIYIGNSDSVIINNCTFTNNHSEKGGAIIANGGITISNCMFNKNSAFNSGGALYLHNCIASLSNCIFSNNSAIYGGGLDILDSNASFQNCTFTENFAFYEGSAMECYGNINVNNSIFWSNFGRQITGNPIINYSNIQGGWKGMGTGNINTDPLFAKQGYMDTNGTPYDPVDDFWKEGDYHLKSRAGRWDYVSKIWIKDNSTSPCIDTGDPFMDPNEELWPHGRRINMGAYGGTSQASMSPSNYGDRRDLNNDDLVNWEDVLILADKWDYANAPLKEDLNRNGIIDVNDFAFFYGNWPGNSNNILPSLDLIEDQHVIAGNEVSFSISAIDTNGDELTYKALGLPEDAEFSNQIFSWTPEQAGEYSVIFIVSDYKSLHFITVNILVECQ